MLKKCLAMKLVNDTRANLEKEYRAVKLLREKLTRLAEEQTKVDRISAEAQASYAKANQYLEDFIAITDPDNIETQPNFSIKSVADKTDSNLTIEDSGIGMTNNELEETLAEKRAKIDKICVEAQAGYAKAEDVCPGIFVFGSGGSERRGDPYGSGGCSVPVHSRSASAPDAAGGRPGRAHAAGACFGAGRRRSQDHATEAHPAADS